MLPNCRTCASNCDHRSTVSSWSTKACSGKFWTHKKLPCGGMAADRGSNALCMRMGIASNLGIREPCPASLPLKQRRNSLNQVHSVRANRPGGMGFSDLPLAFFNALIFDNWTADWTASALPGLSGTPERLKIACQSILMRSAYASVFCCRGIDRAVYAPCLPQQGSCIAFSPQASGSPAVSHTGQIS